MIYNTSNPKAMSQLSEQELNQINEEAERLHPATYLTQSGVYLDDMNCGLKRRIHIAAATLYREMINGLLEALEAVKGMKLEPNETDCKYAYNRCWHIADKSLTNYNESLKG